MKKTQKVISEGCYKDIFDNANDLIFIHDLPDGTFLEANNALYTLTGFTKKEVIGHRIDEFILPEYTNFLKKYLKDIEQNGNLKGLFSVIKKDGKKLVLEFNNSLIYDGNKNIGVRGIARDVTEEYKAKYKTNQAEKRLEQLNLILRAIRNINQLINREHDRKKLLDGICSILVKNRYTGAWIATTGEDGNFTHFAYEGVGKKFPLLIERLKKGDYTYCTKRALETFGVTVVEDPLKTCSDCPLVRSYKKIKILNTRLEHAGRVYGVINVSLNSYLETEQEELSLFFELANDIAYALHVIELEEERKKTTKKLEENELKWSLFMDSATDEFYLLDANLKILEVNKRGLEVLGVRKDDLIGKNLLNIIPEIKSQDRYHGYLDVIATGKPYFVEVKNESSQYEQTHFANRAFKVGDGLGVISSDISKQKQLEEELTKLSITDNLTGLFNQRHFYKKIEEEMNRAKRSSHLLSLIIFDVDNFKVYNDSYGHLKGDEVLKSIGEISIESIRKDVDTAFRYGGDEFAILVPYASRENVFELSKRLRARIEKRIKKISISIGISSLKPLHSIKRFINTADKAMYADKELRKNNNTSARVSLFRSLHNLQKP